MPFAGESAPITKPMVGYAYVPIQQADMRNISSPEDALNNGTVFPILNKPLGVYGKQLSGDKMFEEKKQQDEISKVTDNKKSANGGVNND